MGFVNIPYRPSGVDFKSIEGILSDFDAIIGTINGNLDATNMASETLTQRPTSVDTTIVTGLVNSLIAIPSSPCSVSYVLSLPKIALVSARAVVDKTVGNTAAVYMGLLLDGNPINDSLGQNGHIQNSGGGIPPIVSALFLTGDPQHGISAPIISGGGDFGTTITPEMIAPTIAIYLPSGTHTLALGFAIDSGGTYQVNSQALSVFV